MNLQEAGYQLQHNYIGISVCISHWNTRKTFTRQQKHQAVSLFGAKIQTVSASKRLVNPRHPQVKAVTKAYKAIKYFYEASTLPYIETSKRLLPSIKENDFNEKIAQLGAEMMDCVCKMQEHRDEIVQEGREGLKDLWQETDYPMDFYTHYGVTITKSTLMPPVYLQVNNPEEYQRRLEQFQVQMQQAVVNAEQALTDEMATLVHNLSERLGLDEHGNPKRFRTSALQTLRDFFARFQELKIRDDTEIDSAIREAQGLLNGYEARDLREPGFLRGQIQDGMRRIEEQLIPLITPRVRRRLGVKLQPTSFEEETETAHAE